MLTAGDVTLLRAGDKDVLVDAAGTELGALGEQRGCVTDGSTLIACPDDYSGIRMFDLATREITTATFDDEFARLDSAGAGRLVLRDRDDAGFFSADRFGNRIDENLPSGVVAASDTHVLFHARSAEGVDVISVHPLTV